MERRKRVKTFFPDLIKSKSSKPVSDWLFPSMESLKNAKPAVSQHVLLKSTFYQNYDAEILKLELERKKAIEKAQIEEEDNRKLKEADDFKMHQIINRQVDQVLTQRRYFYKRNCPVKIPFKSTATEEEHLAYLRAFIKFQIRPPKTAMEEAEYQNYLTLQSTFLDEQTCLMNFSYEVMKLHLPVINKTPDVINSYIAAYVEHRSKRAFKYSKSYTHEIDIPIKPQDPKGNLNNLTFNYVGNVLSMGTAAQLYIPDPRKEIVFPGYSNMNNMSPYCDGKYDRNKYLYKTPVSEDPNAEILAEKHKVSIVMSASAFKTLINNQDTFDKEWTIPVRIKMQTVKDSSGNKIQQRVVYLDKPLVRKTWLPLQKKKKYYKTAALASLSKYSPHHFYQIDGKISASMGTPKEVYESFGSLKSNRNFYKDSSRKIPLRSQNHLNQNSADIPQPISFDMNLRACLEDLKPPAKLNNSKELKKIENVAEPSGFLDGILSEQSSMLKNKPSSPKQCQTTSNIRSYINDSDSSTTLDMPWSQLAESDIDRFKVVKECPPMSTMNMHYQLFSLNNPNMNESLPILIRHNIDGITPPHKIHNSKAVVVHPKIEGQAYFGSEVNSLNDVVDQWASLVTKPNTLLLQVHICTETGTVIMTSKKTLVDILKEGKQKHINFHPETVLSSLFVALEATLRMPTGEYILYHSGKTEAFIQLMKAASEDQYMTSRPILNIHAAYEKGEMLSRIYTSPPWLAIDTHVLTPFHLTHSKVPGTFPMENVQQLTKKRKNFIKSRAKKKMTLDRV